MITKVPKRGASITVNYRLQEALTTKPIFLQSRNIEAKGWESRRASAHQRKTASVCRIAFLQGNQHAERQAGAIFRVLMSRRLLYCVLELVINWAWQPTRRCMSVALSCKLTSLSPCIIYLSSLYTKIVQMRAFQRSANSQAPISLPKEQSAWLKLICST